MFLSVEWAKRWLPAVFLLLSLFLPWWTMVRLRTPEGGDFALRQEVWFSLSFPWSDDARVQLLYYQYLWPEYSGESLIESIFVSILEVWHIPYLFLTSALIVVAWLFGLSHRNKIRTLGGTLGIAGIISYFIFVFQKCNELFSRYIHGENPYFGYYFEKFPMRGAEVEITRVWFLSAGFYLALAGSLMLLFPFIRTLVERLRKRL